MVKELLKSNGGLLTVNTVFGSWLHIAASYGRIDIASYLIDCGIDVNRNGDISGGNPIRSAAENGQIEMVEFLYNHGTEFDVSEAAKILYLEQSMEGIIMSFNFWLNMELTFIRKTHCQKDFMLWRGSARLGGVSGVDFNVLGNLAELVRKLKVNADIAVFVNLDMVYQLNQNFAGQLFDVLIFCKSYQRGMLLVNAV